jgi:hypothetical protein
MAMVVAFIGTCQRKQKETSIELGFLRENDQLPTRGPVYSAIVVHIHGCMKGAKSTMGIAVIGNSSQRSPLMNIAFAVSRPVSVPCQEKKRPSRFVKSKELSRFGGFAPVSTTQEIRHSSSAPRFVLVQGLQKERRLVVKQSLTGRPCFGQCQSFRDLWYLPNTTVRQECTKIPGQVRKHAYVPLL